jgi:hypothetical protein
MFSGTMQTLQEGMWKERLDSLFLLLKVSQFGIPATDIPNMVARRLSVGRVIGKGKVVPVHTMKAYRWSRSIAPLNLNLSIRWK